MQSDLPTSSQVATHSVGARPEVRAFWTGPQLSPYEELSLRSFIAGGARVLLYSPNRKLRVPEGVELVDAAEILSGEVHSFTFADGVRSPALHSDLFRYLAIQRHGGWYADLDIVLVAKEMPRSKVYLAWESEKLVNGAVMTFPATSPFISAAIEEAWKLLPEAGPGAPLSKRISIGPELVTRLAQDYALDLHVRPRSAAYEITYDEIPSLFDPSLRDELDERVSKSDFVHFWNEIWRRVRIPQNYGPPAGSFLDGLFQRFGMEFADDGRLSMDTISVWFQERNALDQLRWRLRTELLPRNALDEAIAQARGDRPRVIYSLAKELPRESNMARTRIAMAPQNLRSFWHGETIGAYQLLCFRSFVERGHSVELFTFEPHLDLPGWITRRDAAEILPRERVLRHLPEHGKMAVNADLFRLALLHRLGGWWIDPDVVLLRSELPAADIWLSGPSEFGAISTAALKLPAAHPALTDALILAGSREDEMEDGGNAGGSLLTQTLATNGMMGALQSPGLVSPVSWFDVARLFDPAQTVSVAKELDGKSFLDLHHEVWLRAGVPTFLGPPRGSFLDRLFQRHQLGLTFATEMEFGDVRRWFAHMYACLRAKNPMDGKLASAAARAASDA
ncbi:MAG: hypothetical protein JOY67_15005 [Hyphomicrobiales bacterium]|nr:hypothetical protein [Hyphomicrobiales bacterium]